MVSRPISVRRSWSRATADWPTSPWTHTLLGDYLDEEELHNAVGAVVTTADRLDDELQSRFGGKRSEDLDA